jgi:oxygen-independent coproporphyrinogen-3 oxidase
LLEAIDNQLGMAGDAEISLEANPGTIDRASLCDLHRAGINRLSLGLQALDDGDLSRLGRCHSAAQGLLALTTARDVGFDNLSVDLIYGLPGGHDARLERTLERIVAISPDHLSCYALTVEEETPFAKAQKSGELILPDDEVVAGQYRLIDASLHRAGYRHYEISNFARPGHECRHNLETWRRHSYLGLGAGAHSFRDQGWGERRFVPNDLRRYAALLAAGQEPSEALEVFDRRGAMAETLYLGLRTADGVGEAEFRDRFDCGIVEAFPEAVRRASPHLALGEDGRWRFDLDGWLLFNHLITPFL